MDTNTDVDMSRYRVIMSSDFPPTDVCNIMDGCDCPAEKCSDPDDVQSMVRFLLYTNELDVEGLIAAAGTYVMAANKQNILDMLDLYDQVDENLRNYDQQYPTADALRAVTFEGRGSNNGVSITWGAINNRSKTLLGRARRVRLRMRLLQQRINLIHDRYGSASGAVLAKLRKPFGMCRIRAAKGSSIPSSASFASF